MLIQKKVAQYPLSKQLAIRIWFKKETKDNGLGFHRINKPAFVYTGPEKIGVYMQYWENDHFLYAQNIEKQC